MTNPSDDLETRVRRLEHDMVRVRADAAAARVLAGGADRDVSQMTSEQRAHTRSLQGLRETQVEQGRGIAELRGEMAGMRGEVGELRGEIGELRGEIGELRGEVGDVRRGFGVLHRGMERIVALLEGRADSDAR